MKAKKWIALALCLALCTLAFAGCGGQQKDDNILTVATSPDFAPVSFVDTTKEGQDQYVGFDVAVAKYIAEQMGKTLVIQPMSFDACITAVSTGTVDMSLAGFAWKEDRAENFNLSIPYSAAMDDPDLSRQVIITLAGNEDKFQTAADFAGVTVGAQTASLQESLCHSQIPGCDLKVIGDLGTGLLQLQNGDFECMAVAYPQCQIFMAGNSSIAMCPFEFAVDQEGTVVLMQKGADELTAQVNDILQRAAEEGLFGEWYQAADELAHQAAAAIVIYDDEGNATEQQPAQ